MAISRFTLCDIEVASCVGPIILLDVLGEENVSIFLQHSENTRWPVSMPVLRLIMVSVGVSVAVPLSIELRLQKRMTRISTLDF